MPKPVLLFPSIPFPVFRLPSSVSPPRIFTTFHVAFRGCLLFLAFSLLPSLASAQDLPTFDDFRRVDRQRRMTGQFQTAELLKITQIDPGLIQKTARQATNEYQIVWGAAELSGNWQIKRNLFESALSASKTNLEVALRYACAAAENHDSETALSLLRIVEKQDSANIVPWFVELPLLQAQTNGLTGVRLPPSWAIRYRDYAANAARARIRALEAAGYSAYAARRLGFMPETPVLTMARACTEKPIEKAATPLLSTMARAMQDRPVYLVTELVGQSLERATTAAGADESTDAVASVRSVELDRRRDEVRELLTAMERNIVDIATESEMVQYFDNVLSLGEEVAMHRLAQTVRGGHPLP